jgi:hypothetical protein
VTPSNRCSNPLYFLYTKIMSQTPKLSTSKARAIRWPTIATSSASEYAKFPRLIGANIFCCHKKIKASVLTFVLSGEYNLPRN